MLSLIIVGLIIVLLLNIILYINMDRIINFFNNKYVKWYLVINKKFLTVEIFILGGTILYFIFYVYLNNWNSIYSNTSYNNKLIKLFLSFFLSPLI